MIPTGSKLLIGSAIVATLAAIVYGVAQGGSLGTVGLIFAAASLTGLAVIVTFTRDADVSAMDTAALTESAAAQRTPGATVWPMLAALGGVLVAVGLVTYPAVLIFGVIALFGAAIEWMIETWSDRASADRAYNSDLRSRIAHPLEMPLLALVGAGVIIYSFSRIMLWLSKATGPAIFAVIGALVLAVGFLAAFRPTIRRGAIGAVCSIAALGLIAGGASAALSGEREMHPHETTGNLGAEGLCDDPMETHADTKASQSVAAKANVTATLTLSEDGELTAQPLGMPSGQTSLTVTRANPTNVLFENHSDEDRRLVLNLGTAAATTETGDTIPDETKPVQLCTQLTEEGGTQLLTFSIPVASWAASEPYSFTVPGVDGAMLEVHVP